MHAAVVAETLKQILEFLVAQVQTIIPREDCHAPSISAREQQRCPSVHVAEEPGNRQQELSASPLSHLVIVLSAE
ncbi:hypothetical protein MRB53_030528 [Persea americana]|uniref:Uncharacterized protein n=1 Tax=Persea americana TaxID=3435 RepID=A0ACC2KLH3_PERAE|nr:hypothetical protein MRB53_030528 [Persea americana]